MLIYTTDITRGTHDRRVLARFAPAPPNLRLSTRNITSFSRLNECIRSQKSKRKELLIPFFTDLVNETVSFIPPGIERVFSGFFFVCVFVGNRDKLRSKTWTKRSPLCS